MMLLRARRHPRTFGVVVGVVVTSLCLVVLGLWSTSQPLPHHRHHPVLDSTNVSKFIDDPRHLTLKPTKPLEACTRTNGVEVLVVVPSSPYNLGARSAVREGWGAYLPSTWTLVFYIGAVNRPSIQERLIAESQKHKDVAQDPSFPDVYDTLTLKTLAFLSWANQACPSARFILKADDDVFLNIPRLQTLTKCLHSAMHNVYKEKAQKSDSSASVIDEDACEESKGYVSHYVDAVTHNYESYLLGGYLYTGVKPDRSVTSKWQLPKTSYPNDILPPYLSGVAYLMSANIVPHLLHTARHTPIIRLEDVYLTGLVASEGLKLRLSHLEGFEKFRPRYEGPCVLQGLLTAHGFMPGELRAAAHTTLDLPEDACGGLLTRAGLALNDILTALFPRIPSDGMSENDIEAVI